MTEREQEIQVSLNADKMLRQALDIKDNNKLIAEFMGMTNHHNDKSMMVRKTLQGNEVIFIDKLEYHCSWDWLMPVIENIDHLQYERCFSTSTSHNPVMSIEKALSTRSIDDTYRAVVQFIKEYNSTIYYRAVRIQQQLIMKDNKLIAEFMGMEHCYRPYGDGFMEVKENGSCIELEDLQYHSSWDWLMPVVQKCFKINNKVHAVPKLDFILQSLTYPFIGGTYKAVVEFINEFNKN